MQKVLEHPEVISGRRTLLELRDVTIRYKTESKFVTAVRDINFNMNVSERVVLLGPSGCGKSTLLKAIGGFLKTSGGSIILNGKKIERPGPDRAFVFQEFDQLLPWKTVIENIMFAAVKGKGLSKKEAKERALALTRKVNLSDFNNAYPHTLSGGMKQRAAIARCLVLNAEMILMDEPFAALDALTRKQMQDELLALWDECHFSMIFVTHSIEEALILGQKIIIMTSGPGRIKKILDLKDEQFLKEHSELYHEYYSEIHEILFEDIKDFVI